MATVLDSVCAGNQAVSGNLPMPVGRRCPRGRARLYAVDAGLGREGALVSRLGLLIPPGLLLDAFVPRKEKWFKRGGVWSLQAKPIWPGYLLVSSADAVALNDCMLHMSSPCRLAGEVGRGYAPLDEAVESWLLSSMDASHTVRGSVACLAGGSLRVTSGPLVGREASILKYDRHKRTALVALTPAGAQGPCEMLALDVPPAPVEREGAWL